MDSEQEPHKKDAEIAKLRRLLKLALPDLETLFVIGGYDTAARVRILLREIRDALGTETEEE